MGKGPDLTNTRGARGERSRWQPTLGGMAAIAVALGASLAVAVPGAYAAVTIQVNSATGVDAVLPATCGGASPELPCKTIQRALAQANNGDTIAVAAGNYVVAEAAPEGQIIVDKMVTIRGSGSGSTIISGGKPEPFTAVAFDPPTGAADETVGITIRSSDVTIANLAVKNFGLHGIRIDNAVPTLRSDITIDAVEVSSNGASANSGAGILVEVDTATADADTMRVAIVNTVARNNRLAGIHFAAGRNDSITIKNVTTSDNGDVGISLNGANGNVERNTVRNNGRFGIEVRNPSGALSILTNTVLAAQDDKAVMPARHPDAQTARNNDYAGISVVRRSPNVATGQSDTPSAVTVKDNVVSGYLRAGATGADGGTNVGEGYAIVLEGTNHTVTGNTLYRNDIGIQFQSSQTLDLTGNKSFDRGDSFTSVSATFSGNAICGSKVSGARLIGSSAISPMTAGGNWWGTRYGPTKNGGTRGIPWAASGNIGPDDIDGQLDVAPPLSKAVGAIPSEINCKNTGRLTLQATGPTSAGDTKVVVTCQGIAGFQLNLEAGSSSDPNPKVIDDLKPNSKCLIKATAPKGYKKIADQTVTIKSGTSVNGILVLVAVPTTTKSGGTLPPTGAPGSADAQLALALAALALGLGSLILARRRSTVR